MSGKMNAITNRLNIYLSGREKKIIYSLIIFYCVGIAGFNIPQTRDIFLRLTPLALILSFICLLIFDKSAPRSKTIIVFSSIFFISFLAEAAGVKTGVIFGNYNYGKGLGIKLLNTPVLIGINWVMLLYCSSVITDKLQIHDLLKPLPASLIMLLYDVVLEQVAPALDMWNFEGAGIPVRNYLSWFVLSLLFHLAIRLSGIKIANRLVLPVFYIQFTFFIILTIIFRLS